MAKFDPKMVGWSYFIGLSVIAIIGFCFSTHLFIATNNLISEYKLLESKGNLTSAVVTDVAIGEGSYITYQFYNKDKSLVTKKEEVGRTIQGRNISNIRKGDTIEIKHFNNISRIVGNYKGILIRNICFLIFFFLLSILSVASIIKVYLIKKQRLLEIDARRLKQ